MLDDVPSPLRLAAPAKINLFLEVTGRRADGYHELVTCMAPLAWADELTFTAADQLSLTCDDPSLPLDANNLVLKLVEEVDAFKGDAPQHDDMTALVMKRIS